MRMLMAVCSRCHRPLKRQPWAGRGIGPICARRLSFDFQTPDQSSGAQVTVNGRPLEHVVLHSPTGFSWGYGGSGPADLALSILADYTGDLVLAQQLHQQLKWDVVSRWPQDEAWRLTGEQVYAWLCQHTLRQAVSIPYRPDVIYEGRPYSRGKE